MGFKSEVNIYYPFHAYADCRLKNRQHWRVAEDCIIVELTNGSRLKIPAWMTSVEAAVFEIAESPAVDIESLKLVCELVEKFQEKEQEETVGKQVTLIGSNPKPKEGKANESASALDKGRESRQVRRKCRSGDRFDYGRSNTSRGPGKKGGKR